MKPVLVIFPEFLNGSVFFQLWIGFNNTDVTLIEQLLHFIKKNGCNSFILIVWMYPDQIKRGTIVLAKCVDKIEKIKKIDGTVNFFECLCKGRHGDRKRDKLPLAVYDTFNKIRVDEFDIAFFIMFNLVVSN